MVCYRCKAKCSKGSSYCWKCGKSFNSKKNVHVKNVKVQKIYYQEDDSVAGGSFILGGLIGYLLGTNKDDKKNNK